MKQTYTIPRDAIRAVACCAAKKDRRHYLNGVLIEVSATGAGRVVATDGHILGVMRFDSDRVVDEDRGPEILAPISLIVPLEALPKSSAPYIVTLQQLDDLRWILNGQLFTPIDGKFLDYVRVIPRTVTGIACQANPELIARFGAAATILGSHKLGASAVRIGWNGDPAKPLERRSDGAALIEIQGSPDFIGVLMPLRADASDYPTAAPDWAIQRLDLTPVEDPIAASADVERAAAVARLDADAIQRDADRAAAHP